MSRFNEYATTIITNLSSLISHAMVELECEQTTPRHSADASDDFIKFHAERVEVLREMRNNIENEMARQPNPGVLR